MLQSVHVPIVPFAIQPIIKERDVFAWHLGFREHAWEVESSHILIWERTRTDRGDPVEEGVADSARYQAKPLPQLVEPVRQLVRQLPSLPPLSQPHRVGRVLLQRQQHQLLPAFRQ